MKKIMIFAAAMSISVMSALTAYAGQWKQDEAGIWYENDDGTWPTGWYEDEDGNWYLFEDSGYAHLGWYEDNGVSYYFFYNNGRMAKECVVGMHGDYYQFDASGAGCRLGEGYSGWIYDGQYWYYRTENGSYAGDGWRTVNGERYFFQEGRMMTGPAEIYGEWYFFDGNGHPVTGLAELDGKYYFVGEDGTLVRNESREIDGVTYSFDENGAAEKPVSEAPVIESVPDWPYKPITYIPPDSEKSDLHKTCDQMADQILAGIVNDGMTQRQKAEAIYAWVRGNMHYSNGYEIDNWVEEAYQGLRRRHGDCYTYFSVSQLLLSRVGIPSIEVVRYTDNHHYWNLVQIDGQWWHFDATPRRLGGYFCLWTDAQMLDYSRSHGGCFEFDRSLYPRTP